PACVESMVEATEAANIHLRVEVGDRFCRSGTEVTKRALDCTKDALHISICERGRYETHNFAVSWILISVDELDGIGSEVLFLRKLIDERVEVVLKRHENNKPRIKRI